MHVKKLLLLLSVINISITYGSELKSDEHVLFIPNIAYQTPDNKLAISIQAWVYEKERRPGMTTLLAKYLGINKDELTHEEYDLLYQRSQLFRVDSERGKVLSIKLNNTTYTLPKTDKGGVTNQVIYLNTIPSQQSNHSISYSISDLNLPESTNTGLSFFNKETGLSVISDIDDTIKDSQVSDQKQLLINTFIKPFKVIDSMRDWYQKMANNGVAFHYLSSSPIQLYPALKDFMDKAQFPAGSVHLREATTWHSIIPTGDDSRNHKLSTLEKLLNAYPKRQFILIGDSGEADPEIYAQTMTKYPTQIKCIAIRNVTNEDEQSPRYKQLFAGVDSYKWQIFTDPTTINNTCAPRE